MPLFMDVHRNVNGVTAQGLEELHKKDLAVQGKHKVKYLKYWFSDSDNAVFCLSEAPNKEAASAVHREAHGAEADEIYEVTEGQ